MNEAIEDASKALKEANTFSDTIVVSSGDNAGRVH